MLLSGPDLIVSELKVLSYNSSEITYGYTIKNIGDEAANLDGPTDEEYDNVGVQAFLSADTIFNNAGDVAAGGTIVGISPLGLLQPGETISGDFGASAAVNPETHPYLTLMADWRDHVEETDETNNTAAVLITSDGGLSGPDLIVSRLEIVSYTESWTRVAYTLKNIGDVPANLDTEQDTITVQAFRSADTVFNNEGDIAVGGTIIGLSPLGLLQPGESISGEFHAGSTAPFTGEVIDLATHPYLTLMADWGRDVDEVNETNNTAAVLITSGGGQSGPDLIVSRLEVLSYTNDQVTYGYTLKNVGDEAANLDGPTDEGYDNVSIQAFFSADPHFNNVGDLAAGGTILGLSPLGLLLPGETFNGEETASIGSVIPDTHPYLTLMADWGGSVEEPDETNNTAAVLISSGPEILRLQQVAFFQGEECLYSASADDIKGNVKGVVPLDGVLKGDRIKIEADLTQRAPGELNTKFVVRIPGPDIETSGGLVKGDYITTSDGGSIEYELSDWDTNDFASIKICVQRTNVAVTVPSLNADGGLHTEATVNDLSFNAGGKFIPLELYYARMEEDNTIVLINQPFNTPDRKPKGIDVGAGKTTPLDIAPADVPPPPEGATHVVATFNRPPSDGSSRAPESIYADNSQYTAITSLLPNIALRDEFRRRDDGGIEITYTVGTIGVSPVLANDVMVEWFYVDAKQPADKLFGDPIAATRSPLSLVANWEQAVLLSSSFVKVPDTNVTHLVAIIDRHNRVPEVSEKDNGIFIALTDLLPNYNALTPSWQRNGSLQIRYRVSGGATPTGADPLLRVYWARGETLNDIIRPGRPLLSTALLTTQGTHPANAAERRPLRIPAQRLRNAPAGATHILVVTDPGDGRRPTADGVVAESDETDNVKEVPITAPFNFSIGDIGLNSGTNANGDLIIAYHVTGVAPSSMEEKPTATIYWADRSRKPIGAPIDTVTLNTDPTLRIKSPHLITLNIVKIMHRPRKARYIVIHLDEAMTVQEVTRRDNIGLYSVTPLRERLSYELESTSYRAPQASTRYERVARWLNQNRHTIYAYALRFHVDARAIAGAIAYEALVNVNTNRFGGVGKVHGVNIDTSLASTDAATVEGEAGAARYQQYGATPTEIIVDYATVLPALPGFRSRTRELQHPDIAIRYIAAIMNAYAVEARLAGGDPRLSGLREDPALLVTYYNGFEYRNRTVRLSLPIPRLPSWWVSAAEYFTLRMSDPNAYQPNFYMGQWVQNNLDYIDYALTDGAY